MNTDKDYDEMNFCCRFPDNKRGDPGSILGQGENIFLIKNVSLITSG